MYKTNNIKRGDIISFKSELSLTKSDIRKLNPIQQFLAKRNPQKNLIKRVIGLPGDSILIEDYNVKVNGERSIDSRDNRIGTISGYSIIGKSIIRLFPFNKLGVVE